MHRLKRAVFLRSDAKRIGYRKVRRLLHDERAAVADRVIIPFGPDVLILTEQEFVQARERGRAMARPVAAPSAAPVPCNELVTASKIALELSLPRSCIYEYAKAGRIPSVRVGKHVRFNTLAVLAALRATVA